jgi:hypothetical protein
MSRTSAYESIIIKLLNKDKIPFEREKQFRDLRNGLYKFDFYIPSRNSLIEVQGEQHFKFTKQFFKKREDFLKAQERDRIKIAYATANNIPLYIIPFWEIKNLQSSTDIFNDKFLPNDKFFNDTLWREYQKNRCP